MLWCGANCHDIFTKNGSASETFRVYNSIDFIFIIIEFDINIFACICKGIKSFTKSRIFRMKNFVLLPSILLPKSTLLMNFQNDLSKSVMAFFLKLVVILINVSANASCLNFITVWIFCNTRPFLR